MSRAQTLLNGQEGQCDIIFIGYELFNEGFYHTDKSRRHINWRRITVYTIAVLTVFVTQMYFIHHIVIENAGNIRTMTNVDNIDSASLDLYKMFIYSKDDKKIPSVLHTYKEEQDGDFERKFTDKKCDANSAGQTEEAVVGLKRQLKRVGQMTGAMVLALVFVIAIVTEGTFDQVKMILYIWNEKKSCFHYFTMLMLYLQLIVGCAVISISEEHLLAAWTPKSILIDMFALLLINDMDMYVGTFYIKYEIQSCEQGHNIITNGHWLQTDHTLFQNRLSYWWNRIFQFFWLIILLLNYGVKLIDGIDFKGDTLLYGYQPITDALVIGDQDLAMTVRAKGYGIATLANVWVGLFPLTMYIVYCFCTASLESFVGISSVAENQDDLQEGGQARHLEMKSLVEHDSLVDIDDEPREPMRQGYSDQQPTRKQLPKKKIVNAYYLSGGKLQPKKTARGGRQNDMGQFRDDDDVLKEGGERDDDDVHKEGGQRDDGQQYFQYQYASAQNPVRYHRNYNRFDDEDELEGGGGMMTDQRTLAQTQPYSTRNRNQDQQLDIDANRQSMKKLKNESKVLSTIITLAAIAFTVYFAYLMTSAFRIQRNEIQGHQFREGHWDNVYYQTYGTDPICPHHQHTFDEQETFAKSKGGRLCTPKEVLMLQLSKGYLSDDWSYAATRDRSNNPMWVDVSKYPLQKRIMKTTDVKWTSDFKSFLPSKTGNQPFKGGYPFWVGTTQFWCTEKLSNLGGNNIQDAQDIKNLEVKLSED